MIRNSQFNVLKIQIFFPFSLAAYIDAVRSRDIEIAGLKQEKSTVEETHTVEVTQIKNMYHKEIAQIRKALDQVIDFFS